MCESSRKKWGWEDYDAKIHFGIDPAPRWYGCFQGGRHHPASLLYGRQSGDRVGSPGRRIFPNLTVEQNLRVGIRKDAPRKDWDLNRVYDYFPQLKSMRMRRGWNLSGGEQQMLAIARALIRNPDFILMDEPSEGLAPLIVKEVMEIIEDLHQHKIATLLVEQNAKMALKVSQRCYIMSNGQVQFESESETILTDPGLMKKYLGI